MPNKEKNGRERYENDLSSLVRIGNALSQEKDLTKLLRQILELSRESIGADAGSIFIVEGEGKERILRFKYSQTFSKELPYEEQTIAFDKNSIAGYVAVTGKSLNIPDVYALTPKDPISFNPHFDKTYEYRTKSMLVVPMRNYYDRIVGVIQMINCKNYREFGPKESAHDVRLTTPEDFEQKVVPFEERYELFLQAIAGQATIALENMRMINRIENQFEQFVKASVDAIESRDPPTAGHSMRVAKMCLNLARALNDYRGDTFGGISFTSSSMKALEYAGLLHDFGKVYIDPEVFTKPKKLYPKDYKNLVFRLSLLYRSIELEGQVANEPEKERKLDEIKEILGDVTRLNEPSVTDMDPEIRVREILELRDRIGAIDLAGNPVELLSDEEAENLKIKRGTLNLSERAEIERHVEYTFSFLSRIPWPDELQGIPTITRSHHERLDGSGYPDHLKGAKSIPIQSRMMAIADVFDALAAADRPYKKAVTLMDCFSILRAEAKDGKLDRDLVELFIDSKSYNIAEHAHLFKEP